VSGVLGQPAPAGLVHGMGKELVEPDWYPLTSAEVHEVLAGYLPPGPPGPRTPPAPGAAPPGTAAAAAPAAASGPASDVITWRSPRPMSAAALVVWAGGTVFVKRHDVRVRTPGQLAGEHAFIGYLRTRGIPAPAVLRTREGGTAARHGGWVYEVHAAARGRDVYRDALSWTPFTSLGHARAAGATLARLHRAAADFPLPARAPAVLTSGCHIIAAPDPLAAISRLLGQRPGLAGYLASRDWPDDITRYVLPAIQRAAPRLATLDRQWGHGDWHPSNLTWTSAAPAAEVASVFDFGLANRGYPVHDLANALERCTVSWLDLTESGRATADLAAIDALLDGYQQVRPLSPAEAAALPAVFPVVHVEYALSEVEYFADVVNSPSNADLAYDGYLIDHARWFDGPDGSQVLEYLRSRAWT
jgi:Ser/Thr protein kinase RdoA (MazF antagonist)